MNPHGRKLRKVPSSPVNVKSALLDRARFQLRKPKLTLSFDRNVLRNSYFEEEAITNNKYETQSLDKLKDRAPLQEWTEFWNGMKRKHDEEKDVVEMDMRNYIVLDWTKWEGLFRKLGEDFLKYMKKEHGLLAKPEDAPLVEVFEAYVSIKALNYIIQMPLGKYRNVPVLRVLWRRALSYGLFGEMRNVLQYLEIKGEEALRIPQVLKHINPVDGETAEILEKVKEEREVKATFWTEFVEFFVKPWELFVKERSDFQEQYHKFLNEGLSFALMDNNLRLARWIHQLEVNKDFLEHLSVQDGELETNIIAPPKDMYERAELFGRSSDCLFPRLIFLEAEDVILDWLEDMDRCTVIGKGFHLGDCDYLAWENEKGKVEVWKFYDNKTGEFISAKKVKEPLEWKLHAGYNVVSALQVAIEVGNARIVEQLLKRGANPFGYDDTALRGYFSLRFASNGGPHHNADSRKACFVLLKNMARTRLANQSAPEFTVPEWLNKYKLLEAALHGNAKTLQDCIGDGQKRLSTKKSKAAAVKEHDGRRFDRSYRSLRDNRGKSMSLSDNVVSRALGSTFTKSSTPSIGRATSLRLRSLKQLRAAGPKSLKVCSSAPIIKAVVNTLDMVLGPAFEPVTASNATRIRAIGHLLQTSGVFLNRHRYTQIGIIAQFALETNRPGEQSALKFMLFDCGLIDMLLDENNILSFSKYTRPITSIIHSRSLRKVDLKVKAAKIDFLNVRTRIIDGLKAVDEMMLRNGFTVKTQAKQLAAVRRERNNVDFHTDPKLSERSLLLAVAKNGQYEILRFYMELVKQGAPVHSGLLQSVVRCAIAHDQKGIVEYLLARDLKLSGTARKALFDTGAHEDIFNMVMNLTLPTTQREAEAVLVELFTCRAGPESSIATKVIEALIPGGPDSELPDYFTEAVCRRALGQVLNPESSLNPHATNQVVVEVMFPKFPDMFSVTLLEEVVAKLESVQPRDPITLSDDLDGYFALFQSIFGGVTCTRTENLSADLEQKCFDIQENWMPDSVRDRYYSNVDI